MIAQSKKHVGHQYRSMHFRNDTKWWSGRKILNNVLVSYRSRVNQWIALLVKSGSRKNSHQVTFDWFRLNIYLGNYFLVPLLLPIGSLHILEAIKKFWFDGSTVRPIVHIK